MINPNRPSSRTFLLLIRYGAGFFLIGFLFVTLEESKHLMVRLLETSFKTIALFVVALSVSLMVQSVAQVYMGRALQVKLGWLESLSLTIIGRGGNLFTPFRAGTIYRATYLKTIHQLTLPKFFSIFFGFALVLFGTNAFVATTSLVIVFKLSNSVNWSMVFCLILFLAISLALIWLPGYSQWSKIKWGPALGAFIEGWHSVRSSQASCLSSVIGSLVSISMFMVAYKVVFAEMGSDPGWIACALIASIGGITRLIQLLPGSLGIYEATVAFLANTFSIAPSTGFSVAILFRVCQIVMLLLLIGPSWIYLRSRGHREPRESQLA